MDGCDADGGGGRGIRPARGAIGAALVRVMAAPPPPPPPPPLLDTAGRKEDGAVDG